MAGTPRSLPVALLLVGGEVLGPGLPGLAPPRPTEPVGVCIDRGILEYDDKKYPEALQNFLEALRIDPENAEARCFVGIARLALDQVDEAIGHLEKARQLDPADLDIAFNLGAAYFTKGDYDRGQAQFTFIHFNRKEYEKALGYFEGNVSTDVRFRQQNRFYNGGSPSIISAGTWRRPASWRRR